jgi:hypothetical protein
VLQLRRQLAGIGPPFRPPLPAKNKNRTDVRFLKAFKKTLSRVAAADAGRAAAAFAAADAAGLAGQFAVVVKTTGAAQFTAHLTDARVKILAVLGFVGSGSLLAALLCSCHRINSPISCYDPTWVRVNKKVLARTLISPETTLMISF